MFGASGAARRSRSTSEPATRNCIARASGMSASSCCSNCVASSLRMRFGMSRAVCEGLRAAASLISRGEGRGRAAQGVVALASFRWSLAPRPSRLLSMSHGHARRKACAPPVPWPAQRHRDASGRDRVTGDASGTRRRAVGRGHRTRGAGRRARAQAAGRAERRHRDLHESAAVRFAFALVHACLRRATGLCSRRRQRSRCSGAA
jgi:hypothetical protein